MLMIVSALGLLSTALLLTDPPPSTEFDAIPAIFQVNSSILANSRTPAGIDFSGTGTSDAPVDLSCALPEQTLETSSLRFRLKGENCIDDHQSLTTTQVRNMSNGYIATVFHRTSSSFTTDYINLSEGENKIAVRFETDNGTIEKTLTVFRTPSSIKK